MPYIPKEFITELVERIDIIDYIESHVQLKKTGSNHQALCPFHNEKTPSFSVNQQRQFYHCFGCGASGNVLNFIINFEHLEFLDAVETLAQFAGVEIPVEENQKKDYKSQSAQKDLYPFMQQVTRFYQSQLKQNPEAKAAIDYLKQRGLTGEIARDFLIGYAPNEWDNLQKQFGDKAIVPLCNTGLLIKNDKNRYYDRFRGRIIFPIRDRRGRVIAFGGRSLGNEQPKYLNSPETHLFHKREELYGLFEAKQKQAHLSTLLVVEGYLDVIALAQFEINYAVATLGTAISSEHIKRLYRYSKEIVFCFDGDEAGRTAAWRGLNTVLPFIEDGREAKFMFLPQGEDPDSRVRDIGKKAFEADIAAATPLADFFFGHLAETVDLSQIAGRAAFAKLALPLLSTMPKSLYKEMLFDRLAKSLRTERSQLQALIDSPEAAWGTDSQGARKGRRAPLRAHPKQSPVRLAITLLLQCPELIHTVNIQKDNREILDLNLPGIDLLTELLELLATHPNISTGVLLEHWRDSQYGNYLVTLAGWELAIPDSGIKEEFLGVIQRLQALCRETRMEALLNKASMKQLETAEKQELQALIEAHQGINSEKSDHA